MSAILDFIYCILIVDVSHIGFGGQESPILKNKDNFSWFVMLLYGNKQFICTSNSSGTRDTAFNKF